MPAIPYKKTATTDVAWDAAANTDRLKANDEAAFRAMFAWVDAKGDPKAKSSYKFPHHMVSDSGDVEAANLRACSAVIAALNGGRGGAKIPSGDREGVYRAVAGHLKDAGKDVPELKSDEAIDREYELALRGMGDANIVERRMFSDVEFRAAAPGDDCMRLDGHPAVFNQRADLGFFTEVVKPGTFARTIQEDDIRALINHDSNLVIGRRGAATLHLSEDDQGLRSEVDVAPTSYGKDLMISVRRRDITQGSIGFVVRGQRVYKENDTWVRELTDVKLYDVSPVTFPAYSGTDYNARAAQQSLADIVKAFRYGPDLPAIGDEDAWKHDLEARRRQLLLAEL